MSHSFNQISALSADAKSGTHFHTPNIMKLVVCSMPVNWHCVT